MSTTPLSSSDRMGMIAEIRWWQSLAEILRPVDKPEIQSFVHLVDYAVDEFAAGKQYVRGEDLNGQEKQSKETID